MTRKSLRWRTISKYVVLILCTIILMGAQPLLAAAPNVNSGSAVVDGNPSEWDTSTSGADFFIYGCPGNSGGNTTGCNDTSKTPSSAWYMRYDCHTQTLYVLVLPINGTKIDTTGDQYIKGYPTSNDKLLDKAGPGTGSTIAFVYVNQNGSSADGWEASGGPIPAGTYTLRLESHTTGGNTSGSGPSGTTVTLPNCTTATYLASFKAITATNIKLKWHTAIETTITGFTIWRSQGKSNTWQKLKTISAAHPGMTVGASYLYTDRTVKPGKLYHYKIELVGQSGIVEWSDIVTARAAK